ncbi:PREDICTED: exosome complex component RRP43-like [Papilio xuthus]|uniref:Ribosomal RNA-processing protein 43 n=1 Tax=Papilio xuthus TaxID=66420 RepID=A0AAJ7EF97_PAPXU|nr:PREDICTED: exosome complex component RRP43-like [Papilio xuthus]
MAEIYKVIHPVRYFTSYIERNVRPDGRKFDEHRNIKLNINTIKSAETSALVKYGNTTVICGTKLELAAPKAEDPDSGFLVTNVELVPLCSPKFRPGPPSDHAQVISNVVSEIINNSKFINLKDLCIVSDKLAWVLYCDIVCLDNDGNVVDACITALTASLKTLSLPTVTYDPETEEIKVDTNNRISLKVNGLPVATSFAIFPNCERSILLTDPNTFEEEMCGGNGANITVSWNNGFLCGILKSGGGTLSIEQEKEAIKMAKERTQLVEKLIDTCILKKDE